MGSTILKQKGSRGRGRWPGSAAPSAKSSIDRLGVEASVARNAQVFRKGQAASSIYKVESGCVRTYASHGNGRRVIVGFYFAGDYFGLELADKHIVSADAVVPSVVRAIPTKALALLAAKDTAVPKQMLALTSAELRRTQNHNLLLSHSARERVANFLFEMKQRDRRKLVSLPMSRQDIADYLGLTIETVSRALKDLKKNATISRVTRRHVTVHLRKRLAA